MFWSLFLVSSGVAVGALLTWSLLVISPQLRADYTRVRPHAKVHSFRVFTPMGGAWAC